MAIFGQGGLSVRVSARTRDFTEGIDDAQTQLSEFGGTAIGTLAPLQALQGRADETADEFADLSRESLQASGALASITPAAGSASASLTTTTVGTEGLNFSLRGLSTTIMAMVVPALALLPAVLTSLITLLGGVIAAVGGLAAGFGAVIGTGFIAWMQQLEQRGTSVQEVLSRVGDELQSVAARFGADFVPLIRDAVNALPQLLRNIFDAIGGLEQFTRTLREWGQLGMRAIPGLVSALVELGRMALPAVRNLVDYLNRNGEAIFDAMVRTFRRLGPQIVTFTGALARAAPELLQMGNLILQIMIPALTLLTSVMDSLTRLFNALPIDAARQGFAALSSVLGPMLSSLQVLRALAVVIPAGLQAVGDAVDWLTGKIQGLLNLLPGLRELLMLFQQVSAAAAGGTATGGGATSPLAQRQQLRANPQAERAARMGGTGELRVVLEENTDLVNARVESGANDVITERERRADRLNGRGTRG